ncbi:MAG: type VI secretion system ATPase TssH, partial [Clostridia bacterium]|nr:type VI secretion system ATPase TssH [Clostridia bacterium]
MNTEKFTQKSLSALQSASRLSEENGNQRVEQAHLLSSLLSDDDGLIKKLLFRMGVDVHALSMEIDKKVATMPKVTGGERYLSPELAKSIELAEKHMNAMKDAYISVEHLFLGLLDGADTTAKALYKQFNITKNAFLQSLAQVRGSARVNSDSPEDTYDVLNKYGTDLVERARQHKIDPVIGRDEE